MDVSELSALSTADVQASTSLVTRLRGHKDRVYTVKCFSGGSEGSLRTVFTGSSDKTVKAWKPGEEWTCTHTASAYRAGVTSLEIGGGRLWAGSADHTVTEWDLDTLAHIRHGTGHKGTVWCLETGEGLLYSGAMDGDIRVWDMRSSQCVKTITDAHNGCVHSLVYLPQQGVIVSAGWDRFARVWDTRNFKQLHSLRGHSGKLFSVCRVGEGSLIATGSADRSIRLWDTNTGTCRQLLQHSVVGPLSPIRSLVTPHLHRNILFSTGDDGLITRWDLQQLNTTVLPVSDPEPIELPTGEFEAPPTPIYYSLDWNDNYVFAASSENDVIVWHDEEEEPTTASTSSITDYQ